MSSAARRSVDPAPARDHPSDDRRVHVQLAAFLRLIEGRSRIARFILLSVVSSLAEVAVLLLIVTGASGVLSDGPLVLEAGPIEIETELDVVIASALVGTVILLASRLAAGFLASRVSSDLIEVVRGSIIDDLLHAPSEQQSAISPARLQDLVSSQALRLGGLLAKFSNCITASVAFLAMVLTSFLVDPVTAAVLVVTGAVLALAFRPLTRRVRRAAHEHLVETHGYIATVSDIRGVLPEIRVYGVEDAAAEIHSDANRRVAEVFRHMRNASILQPSLYLGVVFLLLITGVAVLGAQGDDVDIAQAGAIVLVLMRGLRYSQSAQSNWQFTVENLPLIEDFEQMRHKLRQERQPAGSESLERVGVIDVVDASYVYPTGEVALSEVDLRIQPGQILGLAGPSGAGKSTLAHLILGLRRPSSGQILVDGRPADQFDPSSWFSRFAYVAQQPVLLDRDVRENVRFLRDISDADVTMALSKAAMDHDLRGWDTGESRAVGISGSEVSGGQRQRIAIARALAGRPDVLILDEPTSALDPDAERAIRETMEALRGELTIILIAHRESTLEVCDVVVRLANGRIRSVESSSAGADGPVQPQSSS